MIYPNVSNYFVINRLCINEEIDNLQESLDNGDYDKSLIIIASLKSRIKGMKELEQ